MKIVHLNTHKNFGGAARAVNRINEALNKIGVTSEIWHAGQCGDETIKSLLWSKIMNLRLKLLIYFGEIINYLFMNRNEGIHSLQIIRSTLVKKINNSDADIVHLHWIHNEFISVSDIARIKKPIVWTLHDMWAFCGAEHLTTNSRYIDGYSKFNRPSGENGLDLNRWTWKRKLKHWTKPMNIVTPSLWLSTKASESKIMKSWTISRIPHPIDTLIWEPLNRETSRDKLGLDNNIKIILLGAIGVFSDENKGLSLALEAFNLLHDINKQNNVEIIIYGQQSKSLNLKTPYRIHYFEEITDDYKLRELISASNVTLIPSYIESFSLSAQESLSMGIPVVCFNESGIKELVSHKKTGYLAEPFKSSELANGLSWVISNQNSALLEDESRESIVNKYEERNIAMQYKNLYESVLAKLNM
jgi:glycosyltransferase involved in cell wall biosynthesis